MFSLSCDTLNKSITAELCLPDIVVLLIVAATSERGGGGECVRPERCVHLEMSPPGTGVFVDHEGVFNLHR